MPWSGAPPQAATGGFRTDRPRAECLELGSGSPPGLAEGRKEDRRAERQRRFRERRAAGVPVREQRPARPKSRPARWAAALAELRTLQAEYQDWRGQVPEPLADSRTAERLDKVCDVDLDALDLELPRGFGHD